mgnify:CR=1 FL=1
MNLTESGRPTARKIPVRNGHNHNQAAPTMQQPDNPILAGSAFSADVTRAVAPEAETDWQTLALRLQAEMDNFRKRQQRRADEAIVAERERLLQLMLPLADNLARALKQADQGDAVLRQGIELTQRELMRTLAAEGVTQLETVGQRFDPGLHEAIAVVPTTQETDTIIEEVEAGYKLGDKLLRPARVVVAA